MNTLEQINDYYSKNTSKLDVVAKNILKRNKALSESLVTDSYVYIIDNIDNPKIVKLIESGKIEAVAVQFMKNQIAWTRTPFKATFLDNKTVTGHPIIESDDMPGHPSNNMDDEEEMLADEFEHQQKINHIEEQKLNLDIPGRILYDLAIVGPYNTSGKLSRYLGLNRMSTYTMIKKLKGRLTEGYIKIEREE